MRTRPALALVATLLLITVAACGVKGPPLPPMSATPQESDMLETPRPSPVPSPSPALQPKKKASTKKSGGR